MNRDYGKTSTPRRMANGGPVGRPDTEWWGQGSDGGASPVAGVRTAAAPDRTASLLRPAELPRQVESLPLTEKADLGGNIGAMTPMADLPAMPKPKALPRAKQVAADAAGRVGPDQSAAETKRLASVQKPGIRRSMNANDPTDNNPFGGILKGVKDYLAQKPTHKNITYGGNRDPGMANGGMVRPDRNYGKK